MAPAPAGGGLNGVYYPPESPSIPDLDLAPNEMLNRNVRILRTTNKAQLNRYVPVAYKFENVNPFAVKRFLNRAIESEDGSIFTFVSPDGNSGRVLAMVPEYQVPSLDKLVASVDRAELTSSSGTDRAYIQLKHRRADVSDIEFLQNFGIYLTADGDRVIVDPERNAAFVEDAPSGAQYLLAALEEKLDKPTPQVLASVNVYEINGTNNARLGNDYMAWKNGPGANLFAFGAFYEDAYTKIKKGYPQYNQVAPTSPFENFNSHGYNSTFNFEHSSAFFDFLVTEGQAEVLTKAKLAALNTRTARITAGDQLLYYAVQNDNEDNNGIRGQNPLKANETRTVVGTQEEHAEVPEEITRTETGQYNGVPYSESYTYSYSDDTNCVLRPVEADLEISLTPVIYENGADIDVTGDLDSYNGYDDSGFPQINNRKFTTQVRMAAGQEIVLGGLTRTETTRATNKPPALGSIPILGYVLGQENTRSRKTTIIMTLALDQIVRFDGDQTGKTADEDSLLKQATGDEAVNAATSHMGLAPGLKD